MATVMALSVVASVTTAGQAEATLAYLTTLYDLMAALQDGVDPEYNTLVATWCTACGPGDVPGVGELPRCSASSHSRSAH